MYGCGIGVQIQVMGVELSGRETEVPHTAYSASFPALRPDQEGLCDAIGLSSVRKSPEGP